jgi:hypothetical protein
MPSFSDPSGHFVPARPGMFTSQYGTRQRVLVGDACNRGRVTGNGAPVGSECRLRYAVWGELDADAPIKGFVNTPICGLTCAFAGYVGSDTLVSVLPWF